MECTACGYVKGRSDKPEDHEPFKEIKGSFYVETTGYHINNIEVKLYACPKCHTVKAKLPWNQN